MVNPERSKSSASAYVASARLAFFPDTRFRGFPRMRTFRPVRVCPSLFISDRRFRAQPGFVYLPPAPQVQPLQPVLFGRVEPSRAYAPVPPGSALLRPYRCREQKNALTIVGLVFGKPIVNYSNASHRHVRPRPTDAMPKYVRCIAFAPQCTPISHLYEISNISPERLSAPGRNRENGPARGLLLQSASHGYAMSAPTVTSSSTRHRSARCI